MKNSGKNTILILALIFIFLIGFGTKKILTTPQPTADWQKEYRQAMLEGNIPLEYISSTSTLDYETEDIQKAIESIKPLNDEDALKKTMKFVLANIEYGRVEIPDCFPETATSALKFGRGDCVSMTKLGSAILRGMGIAVKTGGGCLKGMTCSSIMATFPIPVSKPEITDNKKRGWLHEWGEVWLQKKGWVLADFTNGAIYDINSCSDYVLYAYDNADKREMCIISDNSFIEECKVA